MGRWRRATRTSQAHPRLRARAPSRYHQEPPSRPTHRERNVPRWYRRGTETARTLSDSIFSRMLLRRVFSFEKELIRCWSSGAIWCLESHKRGTRPTERTPGHLGVVVMFFLLRELAVCQRRGKARGRLAAYLPCAWWRRTKRLSARRDRRRRGDLRAR